jgi:hypothetical protein
MFVNFKYLFLIIILLLVLVPLALVGYLSSGTKHADNTVWQSYIGRDTTVGILPDKYANYFTYTFANTKEVGYKINGLFPDTRYFSFNVYSLGDNATQGSIVDYQIETDSGRPNPFINQQKSVDSTESYTVHLLPENIKVDLKNTLTYRPDAKLMTVVLRMYDYNIDDKGGVPLPTVEAFSIDESSEDVRLKIKRKPRALNLRSIVRKVSLPGMVNRLGLVYKTETLMAPDNKKEVDELDQIPFHAIDTKGYIENNYNRYLLAAISKQEDELYVFKFKAPTFTTGPKDITSSEVRYWSFNLGNAASYNFNGLKDEDALIDEDGFVHIVLADADPEIIKRTEELGYNFMEWNMPWTKALILFRHMLANPSFQAQIEDVPPIGAETTDFEKLEAKKFLSNYAPHGERMTKTQFLSIYQPQF